MTIDRQSVLDAACLIVGSAIGASASVALFVYAYTRKEVRGQAPTATSTGEGPLK